MTDSTNTPDPAPTPPSSAGNINHDAVTIGASAIGILLMVLALVLPFISIDFGGLSGTSGAFEGAGDDGWLLGIPPGYYIVLGAIVSGVATWLVFAHRGKGPANGKLLPLLQALGGAGAFVLSGLSFLYLDYKVRDSAGASMASAFGIDASLSPAFGFGALFLGAACTVISGTAGVITHSKPKGASA